MLWDWLKESVFAGNIFAPLLFSTCAWLAYEVTRRKDGWKRRCFMAYAATFIVFATVLVLSLSGHVGSNGLTAALVGAVLAQLTMSISMTKRPEPCKTVEPVEQPH